MNNQISVSSRRLFTGYRSLVLMLSLMSVFVMGCQGGGGGLVPTTEVLNAISNLESDAALQETIQTELSDFDALLTDANPDWTEIANQSVDISNWIDADRLAAFQDSITSQSIADARAIIAERYDLADFDLSAIISRIDGLEDLLNNIGTMSWDQIISAIRAIVEGYI